MVKNRILVEQFCEMNKEIIEYRLPNGGTNGMLIKPLRNICEAAHSTAFPHRDDHYQILFAFEGQYTFRIDFEEIQIKAPFLLWIEPGQIHQLIKSYKPKGWLVGIENTFLEDEFKKFLNGSHSHIVTLKKDQINPLCI